MGVVGVIRVTSLSLSWTLAFGWWSEYSKWGGGGGEGGAGLHAGQALVVLKVYFRGIALAAKASALLK